MILAIFGAGGLGRELLELARSINETEIRWDDIYFVVDVESPSVVDDIIVKTYQEILDDRKDKYEFVIAIGEPYYRRTICDKIQKDGFLFATLISPDVRIPRSAIIGEGSAIQRGCFISNNVQIGKNVLISPLCYLGHDVKISDGCVVTGMCSLAGNVIVGCDSFLGLNCSIKERIRIGKEAVVAMGAVVIHDIADRFIAKGNPAITTPLNPGKLIFKSKKHEGQL